MKNLTLILLLVMVLQTQAQQPPVPVPSRSLAPELDPAPFILGGYSLSIKYAPAGSTHFTYMASVYSSRFPDKMMSEENSEKGYSDLKLETSYAFFADYYLSKEKTGFHFGPSVFLYNKSFRSEQKELFKFQSIYPNIRIGYLFKPFRNCGFYINPWINGGKEILLKEDRSNAAWILPAYSYIAAIHAGYRINF